MRSCVRVDNYKPKVCREFLKNGDLEPYMETCARHTREYAENLIASGIYTGEAWNRAIRSRILDSDTD